MTAPSRLARAAAVAATLPLAGGLLLAVAPAASAAVTAPGDGTVFTTYSSFRITATYAASGTAHRLTLTSPGGPAVQIASAAADNLSGGTMTYDMDTGCWTVGCSGTNLAPNGTWTITQSGGSSGTSTFVTRIRPAAPASVSATALNPREARVSWRTGSEPDLTGWAVLEGADVVVSGIGRDACSAGTCSAVVSYATEGSGDHTFTVQAFRSVAPGSSSTLDSPLSAPATTRLESPPPPPPAEEPDSGGTSGEGGSGGTSSEPSSGSGTSGGSGSGSGGTSGSGGSTGGSSGGGTTGSGGTTSGSGGGTAPLGAGTVESGATADQQAVAQRKAFALGFSTFGPKLGIPKLPPLPQAQSPAIAPELPDGTFEPTLGFQDQVLTERVPVASTPTERVRNVVGSALDSERLVRSTAGALVLLLAGAHLRRWLGSAATEDH